MIKTKKSLRAWKFEALEERRLMAADGYSATEVIAHAAADGKNAVAMIYNPRSSTLVFRELTPGSQTNLILQPWMESAKNESTYQIALDSETVIATGKPGSNRFTSIIEKMSNPAANTLRDIDGTISFSGDVKSIIVQLGEGNDSFEIHPYDPTYDELGQVETKPLSLDLLQTYMGGGDDSVVVEDLKVNKRMAIHTGSGDDTVLLASASSGGTMLINTAAGDDVIRFLDSSSSSPQLVMNFGRGYDRLQLNQDSLTWEQNWSALSIISREETVLDGITIIAS